MKNLKSNIIALVLMFLSMAVYAQNKELNFIQMDDKSDEHYLFEIGNKKDSNKLRQLYKDRNARSLITYIQKGEKLINLACGGQVYACFQYDEFPEKGIKINLKLKNHEVKDGGDVITINKDLLKAKFKTAVDKKKNKSGNKNGTEVGNSDPLKKHLVLLNLTELLVEHYTEPAKEPDLCCPDDETKDSRELAKKTVCQLLSLKKGIKIVINEVDTLYNTGNGSSYSGKNISPKYDSVPDIDPRMFLVVEEHNRKKNKSDTIWNEFVSHKSIIDSRHEVIIRFKQEALKQEVFFDGNISLMAQINKDDPIEVPPYSVIGKDFTKVGVASLSPYDFALSFLSPMLKVYKTVDKDPYYEYIRDNLQANNEGILDWLRQSDKGQKLKNTLYKHFGSDPFVTLSEAQKSTVRKTYETIINDTEGLDLDPDNDVASLIMQARYGTIKVESENNETRRNSLVKYLEDIYNNALSGDSDSRRNKSYDTTTHKVIGSQLIEYLVVAGRADLAQSVENSISKKEIERRIDAGLTGKDLYQYTHQDIFEFINLNELPKASDTGQTIFHLINANFLNPSEFAVVQLRDMNSYFEKFLRTDRSTLFALLTEIHRDSLFLSQSYTSIKSTDDKLVAIKDGLKNMKKDLLDDKGLTERNRIRIEDLVSEYAVQMGNFFRIMKTFREFEEKEYLEFKTHYNQTNGIQLDDPELHLHEWAKYLALKAGKQIYKKLVIGKIDLSNRTIEDEAKLSIYVLWHNEPGKPPQKLPIATFTLRRLGWNVKVLESAFLIDRINDDLAANSTDYAPSNFKPTVGASLLWTYSRGDIQKKRFNKKGELKGLRNNGVRKNKLGFFGWLEPSFGVNVSYLDFMESKEFEVGAGLVMGLFRNKIFLTYGYNFSAEGLSPRYMGIGFSFSNIFDSIKGAAKKNNNNN